MKSLIVIIILILSISSVSYGMENCTPQKKQALCHDKIIKEKVTWACNLIKNETFEKASNEIRKMKYDCCGEPDYVWVNDLSPKIIIHPIRRELENRIPSTFSKSYQHIRIYLAKFVDAVKNNPNGSWVNYTWEKFKKDERDPKRSWVILCNNLVVGSGAWP